jgi:type I restriction enzyme M protein
MLDNATKRKIDSARQILVGKVPDPKAQVEQITTALVYKFMDDMDKESEELGGEARFFANGFSQYSWTKLMDNRLSGQERLELYAEAIANMSKNPHIPQLFRDIFKGAFLPFRDPRTLSLFLKEINEFNYDHSENLGNAFEYLLSILGSQGDAGQFRTPRHIIDFIVEVVNPKKNETILDPACGTAGFLISAYKHILKTNSSNFKPEEEKAEDKIVQGETALETIIQEKQNYRGDLLSPDDRTKITQNIAGYDISPDMVKLALVNLYLHGFSDPKIFEYDTLSSEKRWDEHFDIILANPPFMTPKGGIVPHKRFSIQANRAEVLFVDYIAEHLSIKGRAGIIVPEGIIFQSAGAYKNLRKNLIENWGLYAVVSLPSGVFQPYSGVKTSILLMDREFAKRTDEILFLKIENDGFDLGAQRRKIDKNDLPDCLQVLESWKKDQTVDESSKLAFAVKKEKIAENGDYNLTGDRYREVVDYSNAKWPMVELGEVCDLVRGITYGKDDEVEENGLKVLRANNINLDSSLNFEDIKQISKNVNLSEEKKLKKDDIFICLASGSKAHIGKVAFVENDTDYYFGGFMGVVRTNENKKAKSMYIFQQLKSSKFNDYLRKEISGVNINNLNSKILSNYKIPIPPLEVQEQIVSEIGQYQKIIDGAKQVVENWKPSFRIDPSWEMVELGEVFKIESGGTPDSQNSEYWDGDIKWATLVDIPENIEIISNTKRKITEEGLKKSSAKLLPKGTILVSSRATIGRIAIIDCEMATNQGFKNIIIDEENNSLFIAYMLSKQVEKMKLLASGGTFKEISKSAISTIKIPLPSLEVQEQIVAEIEAEQKIVNANKELMEKMEKKIETKIGEVWGDEI